MRYISFRMSSEDIGMLCVYALRCAMTEERILAVLLLIRIIMPMLPQLEDWDIEALQEDCREYLEREEPVRQMDPQSARQVLAEWQVVLKEELRRRGV